MIDQSEIKRLAAEGMNDREIAEAIGCRIETLRVIARRKRIEINGYDPKRRGAADVKYLPTDEEIDQRCHEFAVKMGVLNPVTTRHATAEEMIQFRMKGGIT